MGASRSRATSPMQPSAPAPFFDVSPMVQNLARAFAANEPALPNIGSYTRAGGAAIATSGRPPALASYVEVCRCNAIGCGCNYVDSPELCVAVTQPAVVTTPPPITIAQPMQAATYDGTGIDYSSSYYPSLSNDGNQAPLLPMFNGNGYLTPLPRIGSLLS